MNFLLKIVEGPNKGAEIALVEGVAVTFGKTDDCDIMLADATFPDSPVRLEATPTGVTVDGAMLANFHVRTIGSTAFTVGPADAPWGDLTWPVREEKSEGAADGRPGSDASAPPRDRPAAEVPNAAAESSSPATRRRGCLGCLVAFILQCNFLCKRKLLRFFDFESKTSFHKRKNLCNRRRQRRNLIIQHIPR